MAAISSGQFQVGNLVFGKGTRYKVESVEVQPYEVSPQDFQVSQSDEIRFGRDSFKPASIIFTMSTLINREVANIRGLVGGAPISYTSELDLLPALQQEWRGDDVRKTWGQLKYLRYCDRNGVTRRIYGRPRKLQYSFLRERDDYVNITAEFKCADTLAYDDTETYTEVYIGASPVTVTRVAGNAYCWYRVLIYGPATNPTVTVGTQEIKLNYDILSGDVVEISSYPWQRRAINSAGLNLSAKLVGSTEYLDQMMLPTSPNPIPIRWTSDQYNTWMPDLADQSWTDTMDDVSYRNLDNIFTMITGKIYIFWGLTVKKYISGRVARGAALYAGKSFATNTQYAECRVVNIASGSCALVIMSNDTMTNFAGIEIDNGVQKRIHIITGTSASATTRRASYTLTGGQWTAWTYRAGIGFDPVTKTYTAYLNDVAVATWVDSTVIVATGANNRRQGFIFCMDNNIALPGCGVDNLLAYDKTTTPAPTGRVLVLWRDAWQGMV